MVGFKEYGFKPCSVDTCLYIFDHNNCMLLLLLWVDDLIVTGNDAKGIQAFRDAISIRFEMKDLRNLEWILGMQVIRDRKHRTLEINQTGYINLILKRFGMYDCNPIGTPSEGYLARAEGTSSKEYMSIVGSFLYAAMVTRPDIAYAVQQVLGRHMQSANDDHMAAAKKVLRYLQGTKSMGIMYRAGDTKLVGYTDADWGVIKSDTRRSTTAYIFQLGAGTISWCSRLSANGRIIVGGS